MFYRRFYQHTDSHVLLKLYLTVIRPHLEYASPVWDPFHKTEVDALENVQKFALRFCLKTWNEGYDQLLLNAGIPSLKARRSRMNLCQLYKIINKITHFPDAPINPRKVHYDSRSVNKNSVTVPRSNTSAYQHSFFPKSLSLWNGLPEDVTNCTSINSLNTVIGTHLYLAHAILCVSCMIICRIWYLHTK